MLIKTNQHNKQTIKMLFVFWIFVFFRTALVLRGQIPDSDSYFLITTGKYIAENKIVPTINPFVMHDGFQIIVQQWMFDVLLYYLYDFTGLVGLYLYSIAMLIISTVCMYKFLGLYSNGLHAKTLATVVFSFLAQNIVVTRPTSISFLLCIALITVMEKHQQKKNNKLLVWLFPISFLTVNIHAAMWPMLFVLMLPFIAPNAFPLQTTKQHIKQWLVEWFNRIKFILLSVVGMFLCGFINPNGIRGMLYVVLSYNSANLNNAISELRRPEIISVFGIFIIVSIFILTIYVGKYKQRVHMPLIYMTIGTLILASMHARNFWFLFFGTMPIFVLLLSQLYQQNKEEVAKSDIRRFSLICLVVVIVLAILLTCTFSNNIKDSFRAPVKAVEYLDSLDKNNIVLYTELNNGAYLEFNGYKSFIDARPEIFQKNINGVVDLYSEYWDVRLAKCDINAFINKYGFTHMIVEDKTALAGFMKSNEMFEQVVCGNGYILYQAIN